MDKKLAVHVAAETVVLGSLTVYLINRIATLEARVSELEKDGQAIARHTVVTERKQAEILNAMSQVLKNGNRQPFRPGPVENPQPKPILKSKVQPSPSTGKKKAHFSDVSESSSESESEEEEEAPVVVAPKLKSKTTKTSKGVKVKTARAPNETSATRKSRDMDDVKNQAAMLARAAESDD